MKRNAIKMLSVLLAMLMITTSFPIVSFADIIYENPITYTSENKLYKYQIIYTDDNNQDYIQLTAYNGLLSDITVPAEVDGKIVKGIKGMFSGSTRAKTVTLSEGIEFIDSRSFSNTSNYITINFPSTLKYIYGEAFYFAKIQKINFSDGIEGIGVNSFKNCTFSDDELILPDSLKYIGSLAFQSVALKSIHIGKNSRQAESVNYSKIYSTITADESDGPFNLFNSADGIRYITVDSDNEFFTSESNVLYSKDKSILYKYGGGDESDFEIPSEVKYLADFAFYGSGEINKLTLNAELNEIGTATFESSKINEIDFSPCEKLNIINSYAFCKAKINDIVIPACVQKISKYAFSESTITSLRFESQSSCREIESSAFYKCKNLKSVYIPSSVEILGNANDIPKNSNYSVSSPSNVFAECTSLSTFVIERGSKLKYLTSGMFDKCTALKSLVIEKGSSLEGIGASFTNTAIENIDFSSCPNLSFIKSNSFLNSSVKTVNMQNTAIRNIEERTFYSCIHLESVILSDKTEAIGSSAFSGCEALTEINIDNVAKIATDAFNGCKKLSIDISDKTEKTDGYYKYYKTNSHIIISGYTGSESNLVIPDTIDGLPVKVIEKAVFKNKRFNTIKLPKQIEIIEQEAFYGCGIKETPVFPDSLKEIGENAFARNGFQGILVLPKNIEAIESYAFSGVSSTEIIVGENTKAVYQNAFFGCGRLERIDFGNGVTTIDSSAVLSCYNLSEIVFGKSVKDFGDMFNNEDFDLSLETITVRSGNPFYASDDGILYNQNYTELIYCPWCKEGDVVIPKTVKKIRDYAFYYTYISSVDLGNVEEIGDFAFASSQYLTSVYFPSTLTYIGKNCFCESEALEKIEFGQVNINSNLLNAFYKCSKLKEAVFNKNSSFKGMSYSFRGTALESVDLPDNIGYLTGTFTNVQALKSVVLPAELATIGDSAFSGTSLKKVIIPEKVETIYESAFANCEILSYVNLSNVKVIKKQAFENCIALESIDLTGVWSLSQYAFIGCDNLKKLYFTQEEKDAYIAENEFKGNETVETVVIGNSITQIHDGAFADCTNLETAVISSSVTSIADDAFDNCNSLTIICLEDSYVQSYAQLKSIPYQTFRIAPIADCEYTGQEITPEITVSIGESILTDGKEYTALYQNNIKVGTATVIACGLGDYSIFNCLAKFSIVPGPNGEGLENENEQNGKEESSANKQGNSPQNSGNAQGSSSSTPQSNTAGAVKQSGAGTTAKAESTQTVSGASFNNAQEKSTDEAASKADGADTQTAENAEENGASGGAQSNKEKEKQSLWEKIVSFFASLFAFIIGKLRELFS